MVTEAEFIQNMSVLSVAPGDRLVVNVDEHLSMDVAERIRAHVASVIPDVPILVLGKGASIGVVRQEP